MRRRAAAGWLAATLMAAVAVVAAYWHRRDPQPADTVMVAGGDAGGLARAEAATENFDADGVRAAAQLAREQKAAALLVMRHEHLVLEQYGYGGSAAALVDGGELAAVLANLAAGIAATQSGRAAPMPPAQGADHLTDAQRVAAAAKADGMSYPEYLSSRIWRRLNAAPAQYSLTTGAVSARAGDWLRVGALLLQDGRFQGTQIVPRGLVRRIQLPTVDGDVEIVRGPNATRLWLEPRLDLVVLRVGTAGMAGAIDETRLPGMLVGAVRTGSVASQPSLGDLVSGH